MTCDPSISESMLKQREKKRGGRAQGETHPPRVSGDKRGPQPQWAASLRRTNTPGHGHKAEPPEAAHLHSLCLFPATPRPSISPLTIGAAQPREVPQHTQTHRAAAGRGGWGPGLELLPAHHWPAFVSDSSAHWPPWKDSPRNPAEAKMQKPDRSCLSTSIRQQHRVYYYLLC